VGVRAIVYKEREKHNLQLYEKGDLQVLYSQWKTPLFDSDDIKREISSFRQEMKEHFVNRALLDYSYVQDSDHLLFLQNWDKDKT
jgi:hypothetical protein